jgi:hypothetical protein
VPASGGRRARVNEVARQVGFSSRSEFWSQCGDEALLSSEMFWRNGSF